MEAKEDENNDSASTPEQDDSNNSWWGGWPGWLQTAKEKSSTALEFMKRDLSEISQVVQTDAVAAVTSTAAMLKEKLTVDNVENVAMKARDSVSSFLEVLSDVFVPMKEIEDGETTEAYVIKNSEPVVLEWWQAQLYSIRRDPKTYCHEPEGPPEMYENWMESFDLDDYEEEMANMMLDCHEVRCLYDQLVPTSVSHSEFWHRYFYRVHLLNKEEAKRVKQMSKENNLSVSEAEIAADVKAGGDVSEKINDKTSKLLSNTRTAFDNDMASDSIHSSNDCAHTKTVNKSENENSTCCSEISDACSHGKHSPIEVITDENRSTPSDTPSKEYSTGDEWEKDFDLEVTSEETKQTQSSKSKEAEEGWEKW